MANEVLVWTGAASGVFAATANWIDIATGAVPAAVPGTSNTCILPAGATVALAGVATTAYVAIINKFIEEDGCTVAIGTRTVPLKLKLQSSANAIVELGGTGETYLRLKDAKDVHITKAGSAPNTSDSATNIWHTQSSTGNYPLRIDCASNETVGIGTGEGDIAEFHPISISGGDVQLGKLVTKQDGSTAPDLTVLGGTVGNESAIGTLEQGGGEVTHNSGAVATLKVNGGQLIYNSNGTLTQGYVYGGGSFTLKRAATITNMTAYGDSILHDENGLATWTNPIQTPDGIESVDAKLGKGRKFTVADI